MKKIIGVVGSGMVGRDPFDPKCWSRSGYNLFQKIKTKGMLHRAFGVEVPHPLRGILMMKNFHPQRGLWSQRFNLDPLYYQRLTKQIQKNLHSDDFEKDHVLLQIGGHYNSFAASEGKIPAYSYHDGNIAGMMKSPFFQKVNLPFAKKAFEYEKKVYRDLSKVFVLSEYWRKSFIEDFEVPASRVVNIHYGVNVDFPPVLEKDYSQKNIVFIGIDFSRKGGENLVHAFQRVHSKHPDAKLHLVGPHEPPAVLNEFSTNIEFHGHLSREKPDQKAKLLSILEKGTLFILPSLYEPFGNAGLEAMLYRMPVIATNDWSFPDFVTPDTGLLLSNPADIQEMADKMDVFLSDPDRCSRAGKAGFDLVKQKYTWDHVVDNLQREISTH